MVIDQPEHSAEYKSGPQSPLALVPGPSSAGALRRPLPFHSSCKDFAAKLWKMIILETKLTNDCQVVQSDYIAV